MWELSELLSSISSDLRAFGPSWIFQFVWLSPVDLTESSPTRSVVEIIPRIIPRIMPRIILWNLNLFGLDDCRWIHRWITWANERDRYGSWWIARKTFLKFSFSLIKYSDFLSKCVGCWRDTHKISGRIWPWRNGHTQNTGTTINFQRTSACRS